MIKIKQIVATLSFVFMLGCSSDEYLQAEVSYLKAKSTHNIHQLVTTLTVLARLASDEYSPLLLKAKQAKGKLLESQKYIEQENYYLAYLSSHDSLHKLYSNESKEVLVKSGSALLPLLSAKKKFDKLYQHPLVALTPLSHYKETPIADWDLLELNARLNKLSENIITLESSINTIKTIDTSSLNSLSSELLLIEFRIKNQLLQIKQTQDYLINLALYRNAKLLITLNHKLSAESFSISQVFSKKKTNIAMRPFINKSKNKYASNKNVIENIFFAASSKAKKRHMVWFSEWKRLEKEIFEPTDGFVNYSLNTKHRDDQLNIYVNDNIIQLPVIDKETTHPMDIFKENKTIHILIEKLAKDSRFFNF
jgi:hypothetical protein